MIEMYFNKVQKKKRTKGLDDVVIIGMSLTTPD